MQIRVDATELIALIDHAIEQLGDSVGLNTELGAKLESNARLRFDTKTDPAGAAWPQLSPATKAIYESDWFIERNPQFKGGIPGTLLKRTSQLFDSLNSEPDEAGVTLGTSRRVKGRSQPYWEVGVLHEWGTRSMPRRGIFTADPKTGTLGAGDEADLVLIVERFLQGAFD